MMTRIYVTFETKEELVFMFVLNKKHKETIKLGKSQLFIIDDEVEKVFHCGYSMAHLRDEIEKVMANLSLRMSTKEFPLQV